MKQKAVIKVTIKCLKCQSKALKTVVSSSGVESAALTGNDKSEIEVTGEMDAVKVTGKLRKKFGYAEIISLSAVEKKQEDKKKEEEKKEEVQYFSLPYSVPNNHIYICECDSERLHNPYCFIL